ncbi:hypothetical protein SERLADRAFT_434042 [Serpula lacrymans var. lacrymans S7.9]|uniref:Uncharacterized protein n=1 Tax=Serpula lacrymans var. lacrymans (strain S7.9) TaxID=578457 RepID=F8NLK6_SERL9|nr:uncharacterized protein SERLADRAFT_434042 [Serpula lacrymans var. lacrymans S7.9]EGO28187.1 hypothetical protein SERLADRAFT_434042 [Serpula lacrymans var. lacrymans S7.9]
MAQAAMRGVFEGKRGIISPVILSLVTPSSTTLTLSAILFSPVIYSHVFASTSRSVHARLKVEGYFVISVGQEVEIFYTWHDVALQILGHLRQYS